MRLMAKKKKKSDGNPSPKQITIRFYDEGEHVEAIKAYAKKVRHRQNMAGVLLIEEALAAHGLWPWPTPGGNGKAD